MCICVRLASILPEEQKSRIEKNLIKVLMVCMEILFRGLGNIFEKCYVFCTEYSKSPTVDRYGVLVGVIKLIFSFAIPRMNFQSLNQTVTRSP